MRRTVLLLLLFAAGVAGLSAADVHPRMLVYPLDPTLDLTSTKPGWEKIMLLNRVNCSEPIQPVIHPPLPVRPFTEQEVIALAKEAGRYIPPEDRRPARVMTRDHVVVTAAAYAAQLNHIQNFVAQYGYDLRDSTLGTIARLRPRDVACTPFRVPSLKPVPPDWHIREEWRRDTLWRRNPAIRQWRSRRAYERRSAPTLQGRPSDSLRQWWDSAGTDWLGIESRNAQRTRQRMPGEAMIASVDMKPMLEPIRADALTAQGLTAQGLTAAPVRLTVPGGVGVTMPMSFGCGPGVALNPICSPEDRDHPLCKPSGDSAETKAGGDVRKSACTARTGCLRQGDFLLTLTPWKACVGQNGGFHGWFGAESCILIKSQNLGDDGNLSLSDGLEMSSGLTIFTFPIDLVEVQALAEYTTAGGPKAHPAKLGGLLPSLGQSGQCCDPIPGPGATLPIGPLLLAITSKLTITVDPARLEVTAKAPPDACSPGMARVLGIDGKATASAAATFDAALTAYVAKAGISGTIEFTNDTLEGFIRTEADMGGNVLRITPAMTYDMRRLDGSVSVFVEVDFFVDTKRWSIELASWDGYHSREALGDKTSEVSACPDPRVECAPSS